MPTVPVRVDPTVHLDVGFAAIRAELGLTTAFPPEAQAEAEEASAHGPSLPAGADLRDTPFFTVDPPGSTDLDQAMFLERQGSGYVVHYAIADVGAFVRPGGALDAEARRRVVTVYLPDGRVPLHPPVLSEGAASLLPGVERQALVWRIVLDDRGEATDVSVQRARVRSRQRLTYAEAEPLALLREIGVARQALEAGRGVVSLPIPEQRVIEVGGRYGLEVPGAAAVRGLERAALVADRHRRCSPLLDLSGARKPDENDGRSCMGPTCIDDRCGPGASARRRLAGVTFTASGLLSLPGTRPHPPAPTTAVGRNLPRLPQHQRPSFS